MVPLRMIKLTQHLNSDVIYLELFKWLMLLFILEHVLDNLTHIRLMLENILSKQVLAYSSNLWVQVKMFTL